MKFDEVSKWRQFVCNGMLNIECEKFYDRRAVSWCSMEIGRRCIKIPGMVEITQPNEMNGLKDTFG